MKNLIAIIPSGMTEVTVNGLHQWDYGRKLEIHANNLPMMMEVHFACVGMDEAVVRSCTPNAGVVEALIPDKCLEQTTPITAWVYEINGTTGGTVTKITLPIEARPRPSRSEDIPQATADKYTEAITAMNTAVENLMNGSVKVNKAAQADNATEANKATLDGTGRNIVNTYATKEDLNNTTQTYAKKTDLQNGTQTVKKSTQAEGLVHQYLHHITIKIPASTSQQVAFNGSFDSDIVYTLHIADPSASLTGTVLNAFVDHLLKTDVNTFKNIHGTYITKSNGAVKSTFEGYNLIDPTDDNGLWQFRVSTDFNGSSTSLYYAKAYSASVVTTQIY